MVLQKKTNTVNLDGNVKSVQLYSAQNVIN